MRNRGASAGIGGANYSTQLFTDSGAGNFEIYNIASSADLIFGTNATERMRIDSSGNVGIGTTSPGTFYPGNHNLVVGDGNADSAITVYSNSANTGYLLFADGTSGSSSYTAQVRYNHSTNHMEFATNNSTSAKMTLDDNGNLGIGTTLPDNILTLQAAAGSMHQRFKEASTTIGFIGGANGIITGHNGKLAIRAEAGLILSSQGNSADVVISSGNATFAGDVGLGGTGLYTNTASLNIDGTGLAIKNDTAGSSNNWSIIKNTATSSSSNIVFVTGAGTSLTLNHDKSATFAGNVALTGSGDKIISAISSDDDATLFLSGAGSGKDTHIVYGGDRDLFISKSSSATATSEGTPVLTLGSNSNATFAGSVTAAADVVAYSDERLKSDIKTLNGSKVYDMRGVTFIKDNKQSSGVIAQELEKIAPELVNNDSEFKAVAYGNISGYLIEAIKDLKAEIEELKKQIK